MKNPRNQRLPRYLRINYPVLTFLALLLACEQPEVAPAVDENAVFLSFATNSQTLPTTIRAGQHTVELEVSRDADLTQLTPDFEVPAGYTVYANGKKQVSGNTVIDFTKPVQYELKDKNNRSTSWEVSVDPLACKILIDASHDGGVWWFPQGPATGYNEANPHQGKQFADLLRSKGFKVTELGRDRQLTDELFYGYFMIIRVNGFEPYTEQELNVYRRVIERGTKLVLFTDHKKYDPKDELAELLGLDFQGLANGTISTIAEHTLTANMTTLNYIAGSVLMNADKNPDIEVLGWLGENEFADLNFNGVKDNGEPTGAPVMGILKYPNSRIFFIGDTNGLEIQSQPFIDNLITWMGMCFEF